MTRQQQIRSNHIKKLNRIRQELSTINDYCHKWHTVDIDKTLDQLATAVNCEFGSREKPLDELLAS